MDRMKLGLLMVAAAGAASTVAFADETDRLLDQNAPTKVMIDDVDSFVRQRGDTFGDRAVNIIVYNGSSTSFTHNRFSLGTCSHILEDINLEPGPYGASFVGTRTLTGMEYSYGLTGSAATWDMRFSFYRQSDANFAGFGGNGTSMVNPAATPYYVLTITGFDTNICPGFTRRSGFFTLPSTVDMPAGDSSLWLDAAFVEPGTPGTAPLTNTNLFQTNIAVTRTYFLVGNNTGALLGAQYVAGTSYTVAQLDAAGNPASPGKSNPAYGRDLNFDGVCSGQSWANTAGTTNELRYINSLQSGTTQTVAYVFGLVGSADSPPAPAATSLNSGNGFLSDGIVQVGGTLTTGAPMKWYKFNTKFEISYAETTFLDIDTEGSDVPTAFAIFDTNSLVFNVSEGRGSGPEPVRPSALDNQVISYGVARRPGVGDGLQYAGQEGILPAGQWYMAVAIAGSGFGDGWAVGPADPVVPVSYSLNFNGNNQKTIPAGPAVSPALASGADLGILLGGTQTTPAQSVRPRTAGFIRFSLTNPLPTTGQFNTSDSTPLSDVTYMDITQPGSSTVGEWNFCLYNNNGLYANGTSISYAGAGYNNNNGGGDGAYGCGGTFAQLSYGTAASRGQTPLDPDQTSLGKPLNNQNGSTLNGDQYYLAVTMGTALFANERWGARSTRGSNLTAVISIDTDNRGPNGGCPADFNGDGGVDDTDFVYFAKYYNDLINPAGDIDGSFDGFTDDGDFAVFAAAYDQLVCF
ncbi:MAG: hypothetical protein KF805_07915 [Phycisphaeraceae bacterium]|nr:hypothetical protein [Phycisphaeraceae bacterium]